MLVQTHSIWYAAFLKRQFLFRVFICDEFICITSSGRTRFLFDIVNKCGWKLWWVRFSTNQFKRCTKTISPNCMSTVWFSLDFFTSSGLAVHNWNEQLKITLANTKTVYEIAAHFILCMFWLPFKCTLIIFIQRMLIMMMMMQKNTHTAKQFGSQPPPQSHSTDAVLFNRASFLSFFLFLFWFWSEYSENLFPVWLEWNYRTGFSRATANQRTIT